VIILVTAYLSPYFPLRSGKLESPCASGKQTSPYTPVSMNSSCPPVSRDHRTLPRPLQRFGLLRLALKTRIALPGYIKARQHSKSTYVSLDFLLNTVSSFQHGGLYRYAGSVVIPTACRAMLTCILGVTPFFQRSCKSPTLAAGKKRSSENRNGRNVMG
jgi:hypothetical protein